MKRALPRLGQFITTPQGIGKVIGLQTLKQRVVVFIDGAGTAEFGLEELGEVIGARSAPRPAVALPPRPAAPAQVTEAPRRVEAPKRIEAAQPAETAGDDADDPATEGETGEGRRAAHAAAWSGAAHVGRGAARSLGARPRRSRPVVAVPSWMEPSERALERGCQ